MPMIPVGSEVLVNTTTNGNQEGPDVAALSGRGFVVTWKDGSQTGGDTSGSAVRGQLYDASGSRVGGEFLVNTSTSGDQFSPSVSGLAGGGFAAVWVDMGGSSLKGQIFDGNATKVGAEFVIGAFKLPSIPITPGSLTSPPDIAGLASGGFAVTWGDGISAYVQVFDASGSKVGDVNKVPWANHVSPTVTALSNGGFVVTTDDGIINKTGTSNVRAQVFDGSGTKVGSLISVNTTPYADSQQVAALADGGFVVTWINYDLIPVSDYYRPIDSGPGHTNFTARGQRFDAAGNAAGKEFTVDPTTVGAQISPAVAGLPDGGFVVAWQGWHVNRADGSNSAVFAQAFDADGNASGGVSLVNTTTANDQGAATVTTLSNGKVVVAWTDYSQSGGDTSGAAVRGQLFTTAIDPSRRILVNDGTQGREIQMDRYVGPVSWLKNQYIGLSTGEAAIGSTDADFMNLQGGDDAAEGREGDDVLDGGTGSNFLTGGSGADTFFVDGRNAGVTWSTVTDFEAGEWATAWGWHEGTSKLTWADMQGAEGYKGATAHIDIDGNGSIDTSMTFTGKAVGAVITTTGQVGSDTYLAFRLG